MRVGARGWVVAVAAWALAATAVPAQPPVSATFTRPELPRREVLDRLNLHPAWTAYVPTDGTRDGLSSVQFLGNELLVQTRAGTVVLFDAETGVVRWRARVGVPYRVVGEPAANSHNVFVVNNTFVYALNRHTGQAEWEHRLPGGITTSPVVDEEFIYFPTGEGRLYSFFLPRADIPATQPQKLADMESPLHKLYKENKKASVVIPSFTGVMEANRPEPTGPRPVKAWSSFPNMRIDLKPILTRDTIFMVSPEGEALSMVRYARDRDVPPEIFRFRAEGSITAPPGTYGDFAYLGAGDGNVYALNMINGRMVWRHTIGPAVTRHPVALENDVYVTAEGIGLTRLDRATGDTLWRVARGKRVMESNVDADRFVAANKKFVYAADRNGRLQVLDRRLGHRLSGWDFRDFVFPISNETTDRLYLAANNGMIVCLHDREYVKPFYHRKVQEEVMGTVRRILNTKITDPGGKPVPLKDFLTNLETKYGLKFKVDEAAFKAAGIEGIMLKLLAYPKVDNQPLGDVLETILAQITATFQIADDVILIIPLKGAIPLPKMP